jgi:hypothetical protein
MSPLGRETTPVQRGRGWATGRRDAGASTSGTMPTRCFADLSNVDQFNLDNDGTTIGASFVLGGWL